MKNIFSQNPARTIGIIVSALLAVEAAVSGSPTWRDAIPALVGFVIHQFVSPATPAK